MESIGTARENCGAVVLQLYSGAKLSADILGSKGEYRSYWDTTDGRVLKCLSDNIFNPHESVSIFELKYVERNGWWSLLN